MTAAAILVTAGAAATAGWGTAAAARWLDGHLDRLLDHGLLAALRAPGCRPRGGRWLGLAAAAAIFPPAALAGSTAQTAMIGWLSGALFVGGWVDWRHCILPDVVVVPLLASGLAAALSSTGLVDGEAALAGAAVGWGLATTVALLGVRRAARLGGGDRKLLAAIGAWTGPVAVSAIFLVAAVVMAAALSVRRTGRRPFGPALAAVTLLYLAARPTVLSAWPGANGAGWAGRATAIMPNSLAVYDLISNVTILYLIPLYELLANMATAVQEIMAVVYSEVVTAVYLLTDFGVRVIGRE